MTGQRARRSRPGARGCNARAGARPSHRPERADQDGLDATDDGDRRPRSREALDPAGPDALCLRPMAARTAIVVGAGIYGVTAALELARRGFAVTLTDPGPIPHPLASSTDISKVIRLDYGADEAYMALMEEALAGWDAWNRSWGERLYHEDGFLLLSREGMRPGGYEHESFALLQKRGHAPERLDAAALRARFPAWAAERYPDGYYNPRGGWAESGRVVERLAAEARAKGVAVREGLAMASLLEEGSRVVGVVGSGGERLRADVTVVAGGAWTPSLLPHLGSVMWAVAQSVLHFRPARPDEYRAPRFVPWAADIARTGWYGFPANADGVVKIANHGPGRRVHADDPRTIEDLPSVEARFRAFLRETFPALADAPLAHWRVCLYCDTFDGDFWIDHDADRAGLVVAAGGSGHAFKFGPVLGGIIADVAEGKPNRWASRFARRAPGPIAFEDARHAAGGAS